MLQDFIKELLGRAGSFLSRKYLTPLLLTVLVSQVSNMPSERFWALVGLAAILGLAYILVEYRLDVERVRRRSE